MEVSLNFPEFYVGVQVIPNGRQYQLTYKEAHELQETLTKVLQLPAAKGGKNGGN
jgi:hypothetical protein